MNTFTLPAKFDITVSVKHPRIYPDGWEETFQEGDDPSIEDRERLIFHATVHCDGKIKVIESPSFSEDPESGHRAYHALRDCIAQVLTHAVLPKEQCPQYELIDGTLKVKLKQP